MNEREKKLLLITVIIGSIGSLYIIYGLLSETEAPVNMPSMHVEHFNDLYTKIDSVEDQKEQNLVHRKRLGNEKGQFVTERERLLIMQEIEQVAGRSGIKIKGYDPQLNTRAKPMSKMDIQITAECQFDQLIKFLDNLRKSQYIIQPSNMKMALKDKNKPELNVSMTLSALLLDSQHALPSGRISPINTIARGGQ